MPAKIRISLETNQTAKADAESKKQLIIRKAEETITEQEA
ncbi:unnamed protein product [Ixodes pacificus]